MSIYNEDELEAPAWLNEEFLQNVLKNYENDNNLELINVTITPATLKGDHFASCMFRAKVAYRTVRCTKIVSRGLIIKTLPEADSMKGQMLTDSLIFETEISMYTEALPKFEQILAEHGDNTRFGPKVIYSALKPNKLIIFEDLCESGYDTLRGRCLNMNELKKLISKLAKFHAVSYKIGKSEEAEQVTKYQHGIFNNLKFLEVDFMSGGIKRFKRLLECTEELRMYLPQFENVEEEVHEACKDLFNAYKNGEKDDIFVLNHGDFHLKNLMFKIDKDNRVEDVMLVDFQVSVFGPSTIDLVYAAYMIFSSEQRLEKRDEIMRYYFENFIATLKKIGFQGKLPSYATFQISSLKYRNFDVYLLATFLPMMFLGSTSKPEDLKDLNLTEVMSNTDSIVSTTYQSPAFIEEMKKFLPLLLKRGYLD